MTDPTPAPEGPPMGGKAFPDPAWTPPIATRATPRPGLKWSAWGGAKAGLRRASYVAGPIAGAIATLSLALTAFAAGSGRGWGISAFFPAALGLFLLAEVFGLVVGAMVGWIGRRRSGDREAPGSTASSPPIEADPPTRRRTRRPWLVGLPALLIQVIAFGAGASVGRSVDRHLAEAIEAADLDDPGWRVDDLMAAREPVPEAENSARVVARAFAALPEDWPELALYPFGPPDEPPNAVAGALQQLEATTDNVRLEDNLADTLRRELELQGEAVPIARAVAGLDRGRHSVVLGPTLLDTILRETQESRPVARFLAAEAAIRAHDGDPDGALDSCRAIFGVARSIGDEPFLVSHLVRINIDVIGLAAARRALAQGTPSDPALAQFQALVLDELGQPFLLRGARSERAMLDEIIRRIRDEEMPIASLSGAPPYKPGAPREPIAPWGKLVLDHQRALALDWMNELVAIARSPLPEQPSRIEAWKAEVERVKQGRFSSQTATLPLLFASAAPAMASADFRARAELGAMVILLAAERHRLKTGDWPGSIAGIDPTLLPVAPIDPFTGQAFRMERRDGQILIYSVGPNREDEHGAVDPARRIKAGPDDYGVRAWDPAFRRQVPGAGAEGPPR